MFNQAATKPADGTAVSSAGAVELVDLPVLPELKGSDGRVFRTLTHPEDQPMQVDVRKVLAGTATSMAWPDRIYLLRKFQAGYRANGGALQQRMADVIRHLYVEGTGVAVDAKTVLGTHVPDLTDYEREFQIMLLREQHAATSDLFVKDSAEQALKHLRGLADGLAVTAIRQNIKDLMAKLTAPPVGVAKPTFQALIDAAVGAEVALALSGGRLTSAELSTMHTRVQEVAGIVGGHPGAELAAKVAIFDKLVVATVTRDVPAANRGLQDVPVSHGSYTVGGTRKFRVSPRGVAAGQVVVGWPPVSDLNYKYDLVHADKFKLCAAHLVPEVLGGLREMANLVPIPNEANGWLASTPERHAKHLVLSAGRCIEYEVVCTFQRQVSAPIEADVAALVPSAVTVTVTELRFTGSGSPTDWQNYQPTGAPTVFTMPGAVLQLDTARMAVGVQRADLNRSKLDVGMR